MNAGVPTTEPIAVGAGILWCIASGAAWTRVPQALVCGLCTSLANPQSTSSVSP